MKKFLAGFAILATLLVASSPALAEGGAGFTATFDDGSLEGWEHGQDVSVEDGVLRLSPENPAFRIGSWSIGSLSVRARLSGTDGAGLIHYHASDQGSYNLRITSDEWVLERSTTTGPTVLATGHPEGLDVTNWVDIEVTLADVVHTVTADGHQVLTAKENEVMPPGAVGFVATGGASWEIDSVEVRVSEGGTPGAGAETPAGAGQEAPPPETGGAAGNVGAGQTTATTVAQGQTGDGLLSGFFATQANSVELGTFAINLVLAALCALVLGLVYVYWGSSLSNRRKLATNFVFITVTTTFIILVVRSSIALSLGLVGALSITRFRTAIKEPEELAFLFVAIGIGIGLGDNQRLITLLTLAVIIALAALMRFVRRPQADVNLHLNLSLPPEYSVDLDEIMKLLRQHCSKSRLLRMDESAEATELSFLVEFRHTHDLSSVRSALHQLSPAVEISFLDNRGIW